MLDWIANSWVSVASAGALLLAATTLLYAAVLFRRAAKDLGHLEKAVLEGLLKAQEFKSKEPASENYERLAERIYREGYESVVEKAFTDVGRALASRVDELTKCLSEDLSSEAYGRLAERSYREGYERVAEQIEDFRRVIAGVGHELVDRVEKLTYLEGQQLRAQNERISLSREIQREVENLRRTTLRGYTMPAEIVITGIAAALQAVQTWLAFRDRSRAARVFDETFAQRRNAPDTREQAEILITLVPPDVLSTMERRTRSCWERFHDVLKDEKEFLPEEVDNATDALKRCICRELSRIRKLNGDVLPHGDLSNWWSSYCKAINA